MTDPVTCSTGITYDRHSIQRWWFKFNHDTCPATQQKVANAFLVPNATLRQQINQWLEQHPAYLAIEAQAGAPCPVPPSPAFLSALERLHSEEAGVVLAAVEALVHHEYEEHLSYCVVTSGAYVVLLQLLTSAPGDVRWQPAALLSCVARPGRAQAMLIEAGLVQALVAALATEDSEALAQLHCSSALLTLCAVSSNHERVLRAGALPALYRVLGGGGGDAARAKAAAVLAVLANSGEARAWMSTARGLKPLALLLSSAHGECRAKGLAALTNLAVSEQNTAALVEHGCVDALLGLLEGEPCSEAEQGAAAALLTRLASSEQGGLLIVASLGVAPFARLLTSDDGATRRIASNVLFLLVMNNTDRRTFMWWGPKRQTAAQAIIDQGGMEALVSLAQGEDEESREKAVLLLRLLACARRVENKARFHTAGAVEVLVQLLDSASGNCMEQAALAISALCTDHKVRQAALEGGALPKLRRMARGHPELREPAVAALNAVQGFEGASDYTAAAKMLPRHRLVL